MKKSCFVFLSLIFGLQISAQEDHSIIIEGPFSSPQEVTETCLVCHDSVAHDIMQTRHWNWLGDEFIQEDGTKVRIGKQNLINNYCIAVPSNWPRCTSCHISYGWKDNTFDLTDASNIDCLVCHDGTGAYKKTPTEAGMPDPSVDLLKVAQSVGKTQIHNCAACHFNGGGGTGVKHGDMDASLLNPTPELDVHMGSLGYTCSTCHAGENHKIRGASQGSMVSNTNHIFCSDCHTEKPHKNRVINRHTGAVACETCHIPTFAREEPTKTWWDWSAAGKDIADKPDQFGFPTYDKKKGSFVWGKNIIPEYRWHNGQVDFYRIGEKIDPSAAVVLNKLRGNIRDPKAKITPFKVMRGKQIYDKENNYLIIPKLYGADGYWTSYDWNQASQLGMQEVDLPYSGKYGFVETEMYWPINHMVTPAYAALQCADCHTRRASHRLDWAALGYDGDPGYKGGRFE